MLIGREKEQRQLLQLFESDQSEFVALYGRRRVGKTYLVKETFLDTFVFRHTGIQKASKDKQLEEFAKSLQRSGMQQVPQLKDWYDAE
jgi:AAA+ ATPase superfamily predicted ATPase